VSLPPSLSTSLSISLSNTTLPFLKRLAIFRNIDERNEYKLEFAASLFKFKHFFKGDHVYEVSRG
jgi:hypothetical protein